MGVHLFYLVAEDYSSTQKVIEISHCVLEDNLAKSLKCFTSSKYLRPSLQQSGDYVNTYLRLQISAKLSPQIKTEW